jgi:hypothetical protein
MLGRMLRSWCTLHRPAMLGCLWMAGPLGALSAAIGTVLSVLLGFGPGVALLAAFIAKLPLLRVFHPPGVALATCPALLHSGAWFAILVVLPFTLAAVISCAVLSRLVSSWPRYPAPF